MTASLENQAENRLTAPAAEEDHHEHHLEWKEVARIGLVVLAIASSWFKLWRFVAPFDVVALVATLIGFYPIFKAAFSNLTERRMTMELSMSIAVLAALGIGEFFTSAVIVLFVLIAEELEHMTVDRGRRAIRDLLDLLPQTATIRQTSGTQETRTHQLKAGDVIVLKPGSRIPVDGVVVSGTSFVDQATITGESIPVEKVVGSEVFAGTINQAGLLEVQTVRLGRDTAFGKIIEAVEQAEQSTAPIQKTADRLAGYLVYFALGSALLTYLITHDLRSTISVVIVAGACGIAAGTPLAILGGIGQSASAGAIIKGGIFLEALNAVDTVVFDKTGTVTVGMPDVQTIQPLKGITQEHLLETAAIAERGSEHPLGKAILRHAQEQGLSFGEPERFEYTPGKGIRCFASNVDEILIGNRALLQGITLSGIAPAPEHLSEVLVARNGQCLGSIWLADVIRAEATEAIRAIRQMGLRTVLLTGDTLSIAQAVGKALAIDEVHAGLLPDEKVEKIKTLMASGKKVVMVGDGVNDAPALMQATVGVAMGSGTDVARESADVVLLGNDLGSFVATLQIARRCNRIIMTNFAGTLLVDALGIGLAAFGLLNPLLAAFIHVASELTFILNSARLLPTKKET